MKNFLRNFKHISINRGYLGITSSLRVLPDFLIIGAKRCGTTTLYENLSEHPCIAKSEHDNIGFFNDNYQLGLNWYKSHFVTTYEKNQILKKYGKFATYDVTTSYMRNHENINKIKKTLPNSKIIVILRNPIDRAFSEYNQNLIDNPNIEQFEKIILKELETFSNIYKLDTSSIVKKLNLIGKGFYEKQLKKWFEIFSRNSILVLSTEEFEKEPNKIYSKIFKFLELPEYEVKNSKKYNKNSYVKMDDKLRKTLFEFYKPYNEELFNLIKIRFDWNE